MDIGKNELAFADWQEEFQKVLLTEWSAMQGKCILWSYFCEVDNDRQAPECVCARQCPHIIIWLWEKIGNILTRLLSGFLDRLWAGTWNMRKTRGTPKPKWKIKIKRKANKWKDHPCMPGLTCLCLNWSCTRIYANVRKHTEMTWLGQGHFKDRQLTKFWEIFCCICNAVPTHSLGKDFWLWDSDTLFWDFLSHDTVFCPGHTTEESIRHPSGSRCPFGVSTSAPSCPHFLLWSDPHVNLSRQSRSGHVGHISRSIRLWFFFFTLEKPLGGAPQGIPGKVTRCLLGQRS